MRGIPTPRPTPNPTFRVVWLESELLLLFLSSLGAEVAGGEGKTSVWDALAGSVCAIVEDVDESEAEDVDEVVGELLEGV